MQKRYQITTVATSRFGGNLSLIDVEMKTSTRRFLMDEDSVFIPLDGEPVSKALLGALCEEAAWGEFDKRWHSNAQRSVTKNDIAWANEMASKADEWE